MFFIIRALFWIGVVVLFLPAGSAPRTALGKAEIPVAQTGELAKYVVARAAAYCLASPRACQEDSAVARQFGARLGESAERFAETLGGRTETLGGRTDPIMAAANIPIPPPRPAERIEIVR